MSRADVIGIRPPAPASLPDAPEVARALDDHRRTLTALASSPAAGLRVLEDIELADGIDTPVPHSLGRPARLVVVSPPRGAVTEGAVTETRTATTDRSRFVVLRAVGFGATVTVDVGVL